MSSHYYYDRAGMSYLDRTFSQRHWSLRYFHRSKHNYSVLLRLRMALLQLATLLVPFINAALLVLEVVAKNWKRAFEIISSIGLIVILVAYLIA